MQFLLIIKAILKNIFQFISFILKFLRKLFLVLIEELNYYWTKLKDFTGKLVDNLANINNKLIEYIGFQLHKLLGKSTPYKFNYQHVKILNSSISAFFYLIVSLLWIILSTFVSAVLIIGTLIIVIPFIHQWIRKDLFKVITIDDNN